MKTLHTPGPWNFSEAGNDSFIVVHPDKNILARVLFSPRYLKVKQVIYDEAQANARLIAAAPELLEALKEGITAASHAMDEMAFRGSKNDGFAWKRLEGFISEAKDILTKATGGTE